MPGHKKENRYLMSKQNTYNLKIGALNCHGLRDKIDYPEVHDLISSCDIFGVTETWFGKDDDPYIKNFEFYPLNRKGSKGPRRGGIGLFIKGGGGVQGQNL